MEHRKILYQTIFFKIISYAAFIWYEDLSIKLKNLLVCLQRLFLLNLVGAYRTTSNINLQLPAGIPPITLECNLIAKLESLSLLQEQITKRNEIYYPHLTEIKPQAYDMNLASTFAEQLFFPDTPLQTFTQETGNEVVKIYTDGSASPDVVGAAFCCYQEDQLIQEYIIHLSLHCNNFQAEGFEIFFAINWAASLQSTHEEQIIFRIFTDSRSTIQSLLKYGLLYHINKKIKQKLICNHFICGIHLVRGSFHQIKKSLSMLTETFST